MNRLEFIEKLYNGRNSYSDHMDDEMLQLVHLESGIEETIEDLLQRRKLVFLTGNPGDGKTFLIKALREPIEASSAYVEADLNEVRTDSYDDVAVRLLDCYENNKAAIIAVNEYPFHQLMKSIYKTSRQLYDDIKAVKRRTITYADSKALTERVAIVDLNERNILNPDQGLVSKLLDKMLALLSSEPVYDATITYNLKALSNKQVKSQVLELFRFSALSCTHFAIRDVLGAMAFTLTAGKSEDYSGSRYYTCLFEGSNELFRAIQQFDPVRLTIPQLDEQLWHGEEAGRWLIENPSEYPKDYKEDQVEEALECFKNLKRRYFFENEEGTKLLSLQPQEVIRGNELFVKFDQDKRRIKDSIILSINKLFLPSSTDKKKLRIWTTHRFDVSIDAAVAVSSKSVSSSSLVLLMPRTADWLKGMEYMPDHLVLKHKDADEPKLILNIDFLQTLFAVENGYPIGLLAPQYEQAAALFLQQLSNAGLADENEDGETILASRNVSFKQRVYIQGDTYGFEEEDE